MTYTESNYIRDTRILEHGPEGWTDINMRNMAYFKGKLKWFAGQWRERPLAKVTLRSRDTIENLVAMYEATQWIPVTVRKPPIGQHVLLREDMESKPWTGHRTELDNGEFYEAFKDHLEATHLEAESGFTVQEAHFPVQFWKAI